MHTVLPSFSPSQTGEKPSTSPSSALNLFQSDMHDALTTLQAHANATEIHTLMEQIYTVHRLVNCLITIQSYDDTDLQNTVTQTMGQALQTAEGMVHGAINPHEYRYASDCLALMQRYRTPMGDKDALLAMERQYERMKLKHAYDQAVIADKNHSDEFSNHTVKVLRRSCEKIGLNVL